MAKLYDIVLEKVDYNNIFRLSMTFNGDTEIHRFFVDIEDFSEPDITARKLKDLSEKIKTYYLSAE